MTKDTLEKFFQRYECFFMQSINGEIDGDEMSELYASGFIAASLRSQCSMESLIRSGRYTAGRY